MRFKRVAEEPVTYAVIFETGDEIAAGLKKFAKEQGLKGFDPQAGIALIGDCADKGLGGVARKQIPCANDRKKGKS